MKQLLSLEKVNQSFRIKGREAVTILKDINLSVNEGEFVAILGPSGAGKSTLLRIIAGLITPSQGTVSYLGKPIIGVNPGIAMVFQSFALFPWLTILDNVMLGLEGKEMSEKEKLERSMNILDVVGLDGFESAFPKELSGGMRQRVGIGRALVSEPDILLMDEAFSALDILTAENLRRDLLDLWLEKKIPTKAIILVTHGIEEAVYMADRAVILSTRPATVRTNLPILLPRWRERKSTEFLTYVDKIYSLMTNPETVGNGDAASGVFGAADGGRQQRREPVLLPNVTASALTGFLELLADSGEKTDLYKLADRFIMDIKDFFPLVEFSNLLRFSAVTEGDIALTEDGKIFAEASVLERKALFKQHILDNVAFIHEMAQKIENDTDQKMDIDYFQEQLAASIGDENAEKQMDLIIGWMRYAELITYDDVSEQVSFDNSL